MGVAGLIVYHMKTEREQGTNKIELKQKKTYA